MSALIKYAIATGGGEAHIVAIGAPDRVRARTADAAIDHAAAERAALLAEIEALRSALDRVGPEREAAVQKAFDKGRKQGLGEATDRESERLEMLADGIQSAHAMIGGKLNEIDGLAAALARQALGKLFAGISDWAPMVEAMLALQMKTLRAGSVTTLHVSGKDFGAEGLRLLADGLAGGSAIAIDDALPAGTCRLDLKLGHIDLCASERWSQLAGVLDDLAGRSTA